MFFLFVFVAAKYGQEMMTFMKEKDISPFKSVLVPIAMVSSGWTTILKGSNIFNVNVFFYLQSKS
jgi:hypothetical protein